MRLRLWHSTNKYASASHLEGSKPNSGMIFFTLLRFICAIIATLLALPVGVGAALAHASNRGHVLLLPTGHYLAGGAIAVATSFLVLALLPPAPFAQFLERRKLILRPRFDGKAATSTLSFLLFVALVYAGFNGSRDPLANPLPLVVWTLLWVAMTLLQGVLGNIWAWLNPWYGPWRLMVRLGAKSDGYIRLPASIGSKPAFLLFLCFAWFELVHVAPDDPAILASAAMTYWLFTFAGLCLFGYQSWTERMEFLSIFFGMIARISPFSAKPFGNGNVVWVGWPGHKLVRAKPLPLSGVAFLLLVLSSVSF